MKIARTRAIRVAIDVRIPSGEWGGIQQVAEGLAFGLSRIDGDDEFVLVAYEEAAEWLGPHVGRNTQLVPVPRGFAKSRQRRVFETLTTFSSGVATAAERLAVRLGRASLPVPVSSGFVEALGVDLIHFVTPQGFLTELPSVFQPHDLLHVHLPETMSPLRRTYRLHAYRALAAQASIVAAMTEWGRRDFAANLSVQTDRIAVVPWAPVVAPTGPAGDRRPPRPRSLPPRFLLYPAQSWPHKNHLGLVAALAKLRDEGFDIHVVCTGRLNDHYAAIARRVNQLRLNDRIQFLGYVPTEELVALYASAVALVFPSRFEGWGLPVVEAFAAGLPVTCSNATVLPEVVGDAAVLFDPDNTTAIAASMAQIWTDEDLRKSLIVKGRDRVSALSWERTAGTFRALYRKVAGVALTEEDAQLLAAPTLVS